MKNLVTFFLFFFPFGFCFGQDFNQRYREMDSLACNMQNEYQKKNYIYCNNIGNTILIEYRSELKKHPYCLQILNIILSAKDLSKKWENIPEIVDEWWPFIKERGYTNATEMYTPLSLKCLALLSMGKLEAVKRSFIELCNEYENNGCRSELMDSCIIELQERLNKYDFLKIRKEGVESIRNNFIYLLAFKNDPEDFRFINEHIRELLADFYYDTSSSEDEKDWSWLISIQMVYMGNKEYEYLQDYGGELYDNILVYKDFFNYHNSKNSNSRKTWKDIEMNLTKEEIAIEISMFPSKILLIKKGIKYPISISIDSVMINKLEKYVIDDPLSINELYKQQGILESFWNLFDSYLSGINRVYISGSHIFTHINYAAIPCGNGLIGDKYEIVQLTSTADIEPLKRQGRLEGYKTASIYGAIDYNGIHSIYETGTNDNIDTTKWTIYRCIPTDLRGAFGPLPGSKKEIEFIDSIMSTYNICYTLNKGLFADEKTFKRMDGQEIDILHISTHGFMLCNLINSEYKKVSKEDNISYYQTVPYQSGLLLAGANKTWLGEDVKACDNDGILTSKEIMELNLKNVKLVFLSACDTGLGNTNNMTGISYGVHQAMKKAGVHKCIATIWKISDYGTSIFCKEFYANLFEYNNPKKALRLTQEKFRKSKEYNSPYYWAGFVLLE